MSFVILKFNCFLLPSLNMSSYFRYSECFVFASNIQFCYVFNDLFLFRISIVSFKGS